MALISKKDGWDYGIAFARSINFYNYARITRKDMLKLCKKAENKNLKIIDIVKADNIIFKKRNMHYATVGLRLERVLSKHFNTRIYVTTRSMRTINSIINRIRTSV